jgi:predicted RNase H-like nuclease (RuvC/YqgF family)
MKDENGRLRKLLSEKEYEINYLKKKLEEEKLAFTGGAIGSDAIATKIVDLSKRIRELNAELESERTKNKQLTKNCKDLEYRLSSNGNNGKNRPNDDNDEEEEVNDTQRLTKENKDLKDKLSQTSGKLMEFKSQCEILKQELKQHQRVTNKNKFLLKKIQFDII